MEQTRCWERGRDHVRKPPQHNSHRRSTLGQMVVEFFVQLFLFVVWPLLLFNYTTKLYTVASSIAVISKRREKRKIFIIAMTIQSTVMPYRIKVLKKRREKRVGSVPSGPAPAVLFVFFSIKRETRQRKRDRQIQLLESRDLSSFSGRCWNNKKV